MKVIPWSILSIRPFVGAAHYELLGEGVEHPRCVPDGVLQVLLLPVAGTTVVGHLVLKKWQCLSPSPSSLGVAEEVCIFHFNFLAENFDKRERGLQDTLLKYPFGWLSSVILSYLFTFQPASHRLFLIVWLRPMPWLTMPICWHDRLHVAKKIVQILILSKITDSVVCTFQVTKTWNISIYVI